VIVAIGVAARKWRKKADLAVNQQCPWSVVSWKAQEGDKQSVEARLISLYRISSTSANRQRKWLKDNWLSGGGAIQFTRFY
jgi:hypothetical protein